MRAVHHLLFGDIVYSTFVLLGQTIVAWAATKAATRANILLILLLRTATPWVVVVETDSIFVQGLEAVGTVIKLLRVLLIVALTVATLGWLLLLSILLCV